MEKQLVQSDFVWYWRGAVTLVFVIMSALIGVVWMGLKKEVAEFREWKKGMDGQKGVLSRKEFEDGCIRNMTRCSEDVGCRLCEIEDWENELMKGGGALVLKEHLAMCEKVGDKFAEKIEETFRFHREWVEERFRSIQLTLQNDVLEEIRELKKSNGHR